MKKPLLVLLLGLALAAGWFALRSRRGAGPPAGEVQAAGVEATLARERAAAWFAQGKLAQARASMATLIASPQARLDDLVRAAVIEYTDRAQGQPEPLYARIRDLDPTEPALHYMLARERLEAGDFEGAIEHYRAVLRRLPGDLPSQVGLASVLADLDRTQEAREILRGVLAQGIDQAGQWYVQAVQRMLRIATLEGQEAEAQHFADLYQQLVEVGFQAASPDLLDAGFLAVVQPPRPERLELRRRGRLPSFEREPAILPELGQSSELFVLDLDGDGKSDLLGCGPRGVVCALQSDEGQRVETVLEGPAQHVRAFDLGNDDSLDLLVSRGAELLLFEAISGVDLLLAAPEDDRAHWTPSALELPRLPAPPADLVWVDYDHEGDLDLLVVGAFGARLLRNDGAAPRLGPGGEVTRGGFVDVSAEIGLPTDVELTWCAAEDLDNDQDVDLLLGGPEALVVLDSRRAAGFVDIAPRVLAGVAGMARKPVLADFDGDARPDLFEPGTPGVLWMQRPDGGFDRRVSAYGVPPDAALVDVDLDLDGTLDILWTGREPLLTGVLAIGLDVEAPASIGGEGGGPIAWGDLDGDLDVDLVRSSPEGIEVLRCQGPVGHAARIDPVGLKDNRRAVGAVVEVRSRELYRRIYWRGGAQLVGCGPYQQLDVVRITWPNGVVQTTLDVAPTDQPFLDTGRGGLEQTEALSGSCPFLYSWNGATYEFISDVLGGTPLGLPMAPGVLVPPDHDEYVLVRGHQLAPHGGVLELQFTEELREVTYLDRIRLDVVDHPVGTEIQPNERFSFPPFPEPHIHTLREPLAPSSATGSDGRDWTAELSEVDDVHAEPFAPLEPQYLGLATPHWLELSFDPERVRDAERLRLCFTGWFFWTDASVNVASARTPGVEFVPPILQVPGPDGEWIAAGPPVGFPAGKSKTMVIDVTDVLDRDHPRLRVFTTLRLYWDCIRLAVDGDDAPLRVTSLEPFSARLWPRGFSRRIETGRSDLPERFEWGALTQHRAWNQHPGLYTRHGETLPLLEAIDDRFVILGSGDALTVRFDASALPPLEEGWTRDYLVFLDGWAKDRDPNTVEALEVEPLPFHGMSGYPYGPGEAFPDTPEHRAWRAEWNTRPARAWIPPLSPRREAEWALDAP